MFILLNFILPPTSVGALAFGVYAFVHRIFARKTLGWYNNATQEQKDAWFCCEKGLAERYGSNVANTDPMHTHRTHVSLEDEVQRQKRRVSGATN